MKQHFMFEIDLPKQRTVEFINLIPQQRTHINNLMLKGQLINYALSNDMLKLWCVVLADNDIEALEIIGGMPMAEYFKVELRPLMFYNAISHADFQFSLN
jgi:hypothetical protein